MSFWRSIYGGDCIPAADVVFDPTSGNVYTLGTRAGTGDYSVASYVVEARYAPALDTP